MALPALTPEQRAEALKKAAAARTARKELRDRIARGDETIPAVLTARRPTRSSARRRSPTC